MELNPYLTFNGRCEEALKFYEKHLGGKIERSMTYGQTPMASQVKPDWQNKIIHARMTVGGTVLMASDAAPEYYKTPEGISISLNIKDPAEADRVFQALSENGTVKMPIQKTFWALRFGSVVDQFGTPWMINCELPS
jgi:PhnB protein